MNDECTIQTQRMLTEWEDVSRPELSVLLTWLRALYFTHQTHHWISKGDSFFGNHLLFQRIYEEVLPEIDAVAEKSVGLGDENNVDLHKQLGTALEIVFSNSSVNVIPSPDDLAKKSLKLELEFLCACEVLRKSMKTNGTLTTGIDNLVAGVCDLHESHVYLLKAACGGNVAQPHVDDVQVEHEKAVNPRLITFDDIGMPERMNDEWKSANNYYVK